MKTISEVLRITWQSMKALWGDLLILMLMNLATIAPVILIVFFFYEMAESLMADHLVLAGIFAVLAVIPLIPLPPAIAGLWSVANRVADELAIHWSDYLEGFRRYFWKSLGLALINILVLAILLSNVWFYTPNNNPFNLDSNINLVIRMFFLLLTVLWLAYQMYPMALLLEQEDQRLRIALRNAGVLFLARPGFGILLALVLAIVIAISTYPLVVPWFILTLSFIALVCNKAVKHLLIPHRERAVQEAEFETPAQEERESTAEEQSE
ncbi:MAG: DUF624 domain-containing protein [Anaerolineae bacterium]|nr:DUF624 domain-containing protein [Anaerolineae bacterium]